MAKTTSFLLLFLLLLLLTANVSANRVSLGKSNHLELISDGADHEFREKGESASASSSSSSSSSYITSKGIDDSSEAAGLGCKQLYGFLPCSNNLQGHLFLIVVYEYLLFRGEALVASGGERIFHILGPGVFGASAFHVLGSLPESLILLVSGLLNSKEIAQEYVLTGIGLLAGSTILLLTIVWGTCVIVASQQLPAAGAKRPTSLPSSSHGLITDIETAYTARIMVLSVIPFFVVQVPSLLGLSSSGELVFIILSLLVSVTFLLTYFFYQIFQPWIQKRRLEYIKHEHLVVDILNHLHTHAVGTMLTPRGAPNVAAIRRLFQDMDNDGDNSISVSELREFLREIKFRNAEWDKDSATTDILRDFDMDHDGKVNIDEFVNGVTNWLDETKEALDKRFHSKRSLKGLYRVLQPWIQKKREEREMLKHIVSEFLGHVHSSARGLVTEDGTPDKIAIRRLFHSTDLDKDNLISFSELKMLLTDIKQGPTPLSVDEAVAKLMEEFDVTGDYMLSEEEFVAGCSKWLNKNTNAPTNLKENEDEFFQKTWEQTDKLLEVKSINKSVIISWTKAISHLVIGIVMLGLLAEPLIQSVQNFSKAANVPSFFISFILVPLASNARVAISAITEARQKKPRTTSLTFSEIYGGVFTNNMLGFSVLLSLIYFRGLTWTFSAELLIVLIVSAIMGLLASFSSVIPLWTSLVAYFLYPLSLVLVYLLQG